MANRDKEVDLSCCKDCPDRKVIPNCHSYCEKYAKVQEYYEGERRKRVERQKANDVCYAFSVKMREKRRKQINLK